MYSQNDEEFVEYFNTIISVSSTQEAVDNEVIDFQKHKHTFSCYKSNKGVMNINESEGYGCWDKIRREIELQKCKHSFPKFPIPETTILRKYSQTEIMDVIKMKTAKENLHKITKFILR